MILEERDKRIILKIRDYCQRIMEAKERFGATLEEYRADADYRDIVWDVVEKDVPDLEKNIKNYL